MPQETKVPVETTEPIEKLATGSVVEGAEEHHEYGNARH